LLQSAPGLPAIHDFFRRLMESDHPPAGIRRLSAASAGFQIGLREGGQPANKTSKSKLLESELLICGR
jgi:hypothetical protein